MDRNIYMDYNVTCVIGSTTRHTSLNQSHSRRCYVPPGLLFFVFFSHANIMQLNTTLQDTTITLRACLFSGVRFHVGLACQTVWIFGEICSKFIYSEINNTNKMLNI